MAEDKIHMKTRHDCSVCDRLTGYRRKTIVEVGGKSCVLPLLSKANRCVSLEKFCGADGGPSPEFKIRGVRNVGVFLGEYT